MGESTKKGTTSCIFFRHHTRYSVSYHFNVLFFCASKTRFPCLFFRLKQAVFVFFLSLFPILYLQKVMFAMLVFVSFWLKHSAYVSIYFHGNVRFDIDPIRLVLFCQKLSKFSDLLDFPCLAVRINPFNQDLFFF